MDETIVNRLLILMEAYGFSAGAFADKIEVQRSSISHLMSGRNKPSLDFIQKVLLQFPDINPAWLIMGKGPMKQLNLFDEVGKVAEPAPLPPVIASKHESTSEPIPSEKPVSPVPEVQSDEVSEESAPPYRSIKTTAPAEEKTSPLVHYPIDSTPVSQPQPPQSTLAPEVALASPQISATAPSSPTISNSHPTPVSPPTASGKKAVKIVFFYDDNTFETFYPSN